MKKLFTKFCNFLLLVFCLISVETFASRATNFSSLIKVMQPPQTITGTVKDQTGVSLPGVTVKVKDKSIGTVTNVNGRFTLDVPDGSNVLIISFIGYLSQEIILKGKTSLNITLMEDVSKLHEVVVVGYGSQSREKLTTSVAKLDARVLNTVPFTNVGTALEGTIPGLQVQSTGGGQPGAAPRIILRGGTSINNPNGAAPLYIVDGIIRPSGLKRHQFVGY